jgi:hypothetical protein
MMLIFTCQLAAQNLHPSIHVEQQSFYSQFGQKDAGFYDSLSGYSGRMAERQYTDCQLQRIVFGFHPYWAGSDYLNYQWNLLSDFCYFSYEVDPNTGGPLTYHDWLTDPAIDSAKAHGVKVHLCATLFSGHNSFFISMISRQNLIDNLVSFVQQRNADGVNIDFEAVPSSLGDSVTSFMRDLSVQMRTILPDIMISIDLPAVNWGNDFQVPELDQYVDFFFIMGYDYYWNGSSQAGPVSPLYSLTSGSDYSIARTISAYGTSGISQDKFILGVPYYGRKWKTASNTIPSSALATGTALTYTGIRGNSSIYNLSNLIWELNSFSSCFIFFQNDSWNQCFIGLDRDLRKKYDIVNYRNLAGIGIWALGYDNGYPDLWQAISDKFTDCYIPLTYDTIFDSGGPTWSYYVNEDYTMTIDHGYNDMRWLTFTGFDLEDPYDSLWIYAGADTLSPLLGGFSGSTGPGSFSSPDGAFTVRFKSDGLNNAPGWRAVYHDGSMGIVDNSTGNDHDFLVYPNPAVNDVNLVIREADGIEKLNVYDLAGRIVFKKELKGIEQGQQVIQLDLAGWPPGIYTIVVIGHSGKVSSARILKLKS